MFKRALQLALALLAPIGPASAPLDENEQKLAEQGEPGGWEAVLAAGPGVC